MLKYSFEQAATGAARNIRLSMLIVLILGVGIGIATALFGLLKTMGGDPIPGRSEILYYPRLDPTPLSYHDPGDASQGAAVNMTWPDANALLRQHWARRQAAMAGGKVPIVLPDGTTVSERARYTTPEFFALFDRPFSAGRGWSEEEERAASRVVVVSDEIASRLFQGTSAIGRTLVLHDEPFTIIGVTPIWRPRPKFYADLSTSAFTGADDLYIPLHTALEMGLDVEGRVASWSDAASTADLLKSPTATWLQYWVELHGPAEVARFTEQLRGYADEQKARGVYQRGSERVSVQTLLARMAEQKLIPSNLSIQLRLSYAFLLVCVLNAAALLFSKFQAREKELALRRAVGARRNHIIQPLLLEAGILGVAGSAFGLGVAAAAMWVIRQQPDDYAQLAQMNAPLVAWSAAIGLLAGITAAAVPAWRVAATASLRQLI